MEPETPSETNSTASAQQNSDDSSSLFTSPSSSLPAPSTSNVMAQQDQVAADSAATASTPASSSGSQPAPAAPHRAVLIGPVRQPFTSQFASLFSGRVIVRNGRVVVTRGEHFLQAQPPVGPMPFGTQPLQGNANAAVGTQPQQPGVEPSPAQPAAVNNNNDNGVDNARVEQNNNLLPPQHPLFNVRDRLFHALFYRMATVYARAVPPSFRTAIEYCALFKVSVVELPINIVISRKGN